MGAVAEQKKRERMSDWEVLPNGREHGRRNLLGAMQAI